LLLLVFCVGCSELGKARRQLRGVDTLKLRKELIGACREGFAAGGVQEVRKADWPVDVERFQPLSIWAEPDGAYVLMHSDVDGERGLYAPRILSDKDPVCNETLTHVKLADGMYWYDRKRR
jgi:hypothetical protein